MKQTTNYSLNKIELKDSPPNIEVLNPNFDTIDAEMKSMSDKLTQAQTDLTGKAPTSHASSSTSYGIGTSSNYGHVKLSDAVTSTSSNSSGVAATPKAVKTAYDKGVEAKSAADAAQTTANTANTNATNAKASADAKLPLSGGNVTGNLTVKSKHVARSVNGSVADANGNITIDVGGKVQSVNGVTPDASGNVAIEFGGGDVQSVDGVEPDEDGNVQLNALTQAEILEAAQRVTDVEVDPSVAQVQALQTAVARVESNLNGVVRSVNGTTADASGNVTIGGTSAYQIPYATCSTGKTTGAKVATITNGASFSLVAGAIVAVKYSNNPSNTTSVSTLNVNSTGAKYVKCMQIWYGQESHNSSMGAYHTNAVYLYVYDGTYWNEFVRMYRESDESLG